MKIVVIKKEDDSVIISVPSSTGTIEEIVENLPKNTIYSISESNDIPESKGFFGALIYSDIYPHVEVDLTKAKEIWKNKIRAARKPVLEELDGEFMKALEQEDSKAKADVIKKKQELRDLPDHKDLKNAKTLTAIKEFWPTILS